MRRWGPFFLTAVLLAVLAGCKESEYKMGGKQPGMRVQTVLCLNPGATEIVRSRAPIRTLVGRTAQCNWPPMDNKIAVVMNGVKPNYEKITQLRPGMVVYDPLLFGADDIKKIEQLGFKTFKIEGDTIPKFIECLYDLGRELSSESSVMEYIDEIDSAIATAAGAPPKRKLKVAILMPGQGYEHMIAGVDSLYADAVRAAQGEPVGPKSNKFETVNAESLVAMNPDVIITSSDPRPILQDPRLQSIAAIKNKKVGQAKEPDVLLRRGGRVDKLIRMFHAFFTSMA